MRVASQFGEATHYIIKMMKIETLIVTMDQHDHNLVNKMNIQTDSLIGNQGDKHSIESFVVNKHRMTYFNTEERGVGRNRNLLLDKATADIMILADDDMRFVDDYPQIAYRAFCECPDADILIFNLIEKKPRRYINKRIKRIRWHYARYGAARIAIRRQRFQDSGIRFHLSFGGGAYYGSGEDTIFLQECLKKGLKIYAVPYYLAEIDQNSISTWFTGYDRKFFKDKGALYACLHPISWPIFTMRFLICYRKRICENFSLIQALRTMIIGGREYERKRRNT